MENLSIIKKPCNRWPGHSRCVKAVKSKKCRATLKEFYSKYHLVCQSSKARKGKIPVQLILLKICCGQETEFIQADGVLVCFRCSVNYCPICKEKISQDGAVCGCAKNSVTAQIKQN